MKQTASNTISHEKGSALVVALIILVLLTLIGISATTTTQIETQIAGNERTYMHQFYVADSAWKEGISWVNQLAGAPTPVNFTDPDIVSGVTEDLDSITNENLLNVRNFGNVGYNPLDYPPSVQPDGKLGRTSQITNYWYRIAYYKSPGASVSDVMVGRTVSGGGMNEREYDFVIVGNANKNQEVEITVTKPFVTSY